MQPTNLQGIGNLAAMMPSVPVSAMEAMASTVDPGAMATREFTTSEPSAASDSAQFVYSKASVPQEATATPWYKRPLLLAAIGGGLLVAGTGAYFVFRKR